MVAQLIISMGESAFRLRCGGFPRCRGAEVAPYGAINMNSLTDHRPFLYRKSTRSVGADFPVSPASKRHWTKANPFALPRAIRRAELSKANARIRSAVLTDEVARLYRCVAFAMDQYGAVMNGHMTISWKAWGVRDHTQAASVLTEFNARMGKWLAAHGADRKRKGVASPTYGVREPYFYAFIHENTSVRGFHTHQLFEIKDGKARAFAERAVKVLQRLTGATKVPVDGVVFTPGTKRDGFSPHLYRFKKNEVERCWIWFRYLAKNLSPHEFKQVGDRYALQRDIFRIRRIFVQPQPVTCSELFGCSQNIGVGQQKKGGFISKLDLGDWENLYNGSELRDYRLWEEQMAQQKKMDDILSNIKI